MGVRCSYVSMVSKVLGVVSGYGPLSGRIGSLGVCHVFLRNVVMEWCVFGSRPKWGRNGWGQRVFVQSISIQFALFFINEV